MSCALYQPLSPCCSARSEVMDFWPISMCVVWTTPIPWCPLSRVWSLSSVCDRVCKTDSLVDSVSRDCIPFSFRVKYSPWASSLWVPFHNPESPLFVNGRSNLETLGCSLEPRDSGLASFLVSDLDLNEKLAEIFGPKNWKNLGKIGRQLTMMPMEISA